MGQSSKGVCPRCQSHDVRSARTQWWDYPLLLLLLHPYRCRACQRRYYSSLWLTRQ